MASPRARKTSPETRYSPDIVVVIPTYKQPGFLVEAIGSVLDQQTNLRVAIVVVNDGCPLQSTHNTGMLFAASYPDRVLYLRRENGGLSAARNSGIDFALKAWPSVQAIYFLDSDNRILPGFLDRAFKVLNENHAGWVYPDFDMFGVPGYYAARGDYSALLHLTYNFCEAGSLVARAVFDSGVRFDETMKLGFEDWEFWWQAVERDFRGLHLPESGFQYRRRGESMLTHSERNRPEIMGLMRRKHRNLFDVRGLLRREAIELPRYRLVLADRAEVKIGLDPLLEWIAQSDSEFVAQIGRWAHAPAVYSGPRVVAVGNEDIIALLGRAKIARHLFWLAENHLNSTEYLAVRLYAGLGRQLGVKPGVRPADISDIADCDLLFVSAQALFEALHASSSIWIDSLATPDPDPRVAALDVELPSEIYTSSALHPYQLVKRLLSLVAQLRRECHASPALPVDWRQDERMARHDASRKLFAELGFGTVWPHIRPQSRKHIGFLLPICDFGGVEKVVANYAANLREQGYLCHLFVTERDHVVFSDQFDRAFETVNFISLDAQCILDWKYGLALAKEGSERTRDTLGMLATMDVVFNTHAVPMHGLIGELRRLGAITFVGLHLNEVTVSGVPIGNASFALAYEHVYDGFVVISEDLRRWCLGQAVADEKIIVVPNAPSYPIAEEAIVAARDERLLREGPLRVMYLGRIDAQKGLDLLSGIYQKTQTEAIEWRIVGKAVLGDEGGPMEFAIEPPVYDPAELTSLYRWADVVILPSRFEGVPLTLLEAQRLGCVVIATNVGAMPEIIEDARDGYMIEFHASDDQIIAKFVEVIDRLSRDRTLVRAISEHAMHRAHGLRWSDSMAQFSARLSDLLEKRSV